jgi:DDE superfamily endonuclease
MQDVDSSDDEILPDIWYTQNQVLIASATAVTGGLSASDERGNESVNPREGLRDVLTTLSSSPSIFRRITNFEVEEFEILCHLVCPVIECTARSTGKFRVCSGRPSKMSTQQRVLNALMYLKHGNTVHYEAFQWNWANSSVSDDALFVCSVINVVLSNEITWPDANTRAVLANRIPGFRGCIGLIDGTLCNIRRPYRNPDHSRWFNGRKKMYLMKSTVIVGHDGIFIYVDPGYPGSFHYVTILRQAELYTSLRDYFTHNDEYIEYLLGDPGYAGADMFAMRRIGVHEVPEVSSNANAIRAYNMMHAGRRIKVEWGIGGLKCKFRRFQKPFDNTKPRFNHFFRAAAILTNFLHRRRKNMEVVDNGLYEVG